MHSLSNRTIEETGKMDSILASILRRTLLRVQELQRGEKITTVAANMLVSIYSVLMPSLFNPLSFLFNPLSILVQKDSSKVLAAQSNRLPKRSKWSVRMLLQKLSESKCYVNRIDSECVPWTCFLYYNH